MTDYRVALDIYNGPLDLLLFLIRREEIDIYDIPISHILQQYLGYVELLKDLDPEAVSEFLVLAATLMEIKSRTLLPRPPAEEGEEEEVDPRLDLVRQLLQYKAFKDAARSLEDSAEEQSKRHPRRPTDLPRPQGEIELEDLEIWDLLDAFNNLLEQTGKAGYVHRVDVDDTPILIHAEDIVDSIQRARGAQPFAEIFAGRTRGEMIGLFLALLELIRQRRVRASQDGAFQPIYLHLLEVPEEDDGPEDEPAIAILTEEEAPSQEETEEASRESMDPVEPGETEPEPATEDSDTMPSAAFEEELEAPSDDADDDTKEEDRGPH